MEIVVIFILTLVNGFFALSEIALVSVKRAKMEALAGRGNKRAKEVLALLENPEHFLSSIQVGITLIGIVSGAYGGATLTDNMEKNLQFLSQFAVFAPFIHEISLSLVVGAITYATIVIGELVPKTIAMNNPDPVALTSVPIIGVLTKITYPFVWLLSFSTRLIVKILGIKETPEDKMSEDELRAMLKTAGRQGVLETDESVVHQNLFSFNDQSAKSLMTHRSDLEWIDILDPIEKNDEILKKSAHSKLIVSEGELDQILGVITIKDYLEQKDNPDFNFKTILRKPLFLTQHISAFKILNLFKVNKQYLGVVVDEFGVLKGIVTLHDVFEALVGNLPDEDEIEEPWIIKREDGSFLIDGQTLIFELNQHFQRELIPYNNSRYTTVSGFIIEGLKKIPTSGEKVETDSFVLEVVDMDGVRIDKILISFKP